MLAASETNGSRYLYRHDLEIRACRMLAPLIQRFHRGEKRLREYRVPASHHSHILRRRKEQVSSQLSSVDTIFEDDYSVVNIQQ
jgi:hypothetical protein